MTVLKDPSLEIIQATLDLMGSVTTQMVKRDYEVQTWLRVTANAPKTELPSAATLGSLQAN